MENALDQLPKRDESARRIYAYELSLETFEGWLKVGETTRTVSQRVKEQVNTAGLSDFVTVVMDMPAVTRLGRGFRDTDVHRVLENELAVPKTKDGGVEWFQCSLEQVRTAYNSVVEETKLSGVRDLNFRLREEQTAAIDKARAYFDAAARRSNHKSAEPPRFLWNAKMRFGKTFAAYHLAKKRQDKRILVVSYKPAVKSAWEEDVTRHTHFDEWLFMSKDSTLDPKSIPDDKPLVCFASLQDLRGLAADGAIKEHNRWIHEQTWDLVIVDEYHFGAWNEATRALFVGEERSGAADEVAEFAELANLDEGASLIEQLGGIKGRALLCLSGTPFRAIASEEFGDEQIYNWTYTDEQRKKQEAKVACGGEWTPYDALPQMNLLTYQLPAALQAVAVSGDRNEFDLNEFFAATGGVRSAEFTHKDQIQGWLDWLRGQDQDAVLQAFESGSTAKPFPYSDSNVLPYMNHTVWFLPSVAAVHAMKRLLGAAHNANGYWGQFEVLPVAGGRAGVGAAALPPVAHAIGNGFDSKTITLTCGKLLTGVTVPQWSAILMLCNLSAPETYFQAAFRVQSPWSLWNPNGDNPNDEQVLKPACLVLDFAPNRALSLFADYGMRLGKGEDADEDVRELRRFLPVLGFDGTRMKQVDVEEIIDIAFAMNAQDAKKLRMESKTLINPTEGLLELLSDNARRALSRLKISKGGVAGIRDDAEVTVNETPDLDDTSGGGSGVPEDHDNTDDDEASDKDNLERKLQFLAKRINAFMYLSDEIEKNLHDVLRTSEEELFSQVMTVLPADLKALVDVGLFNEQAMRLTIHQFRRADEAAYRSFGFDARE